MQFETGTLLKRSIEPPPQVESIQMRLNQAPIWRRELCCDEEACHKPKSLSMRTLGNNK